MSVRSWPRVRAVADDRDQLFIEFRGVRLVTRLRVYVRASLAGVEGVYLQNLSQPAVMDDRDQVCGHVAVAVEAEAPRMPSVTLTLSSARVTDARVPSEWAMAASNTSAA